MKLTVFYSWQSDRPRKLCRDFIHVAAEQAAARLSARRGIEIVIDSDTQGLPGHPPITSNILTKIEECDAFLADLTFVASTDDAKLIPNPNVMGEVGFALSEKGWGRFILAMNTFYGPPEQLPFDLKHVRFPREYTLGAEKPDAARRKARNRFSEKLEESLEAILDDIIAKSPPTPSLRPQLQELVSQIMMGRIASGRPVLVLRPTAHVYVTPAAALDPPRFDLAAVAAKRRLLAPTDDSEIRAGQDQSQWWAHGPTQHFIEGLNLNAEALWSGCLIRPGVVEHIFNIGRRFPEDEETLAYGFKIEKEIVIRVDRTLRLMQGLGLTGPALVSVSLHSLDNVHLMDGPRVGRFRESDISLGSAMLAERTQLSGNNLRDVFDRLWLAAGVEQGSLSFNEAGEWAGYAPDNAY